MAKNEKKEPFGDSKIKLALGKGPTNFAVAPPDNEEKDNMAGSKDKSPENTTEVPKGISAISKLDTKDIEAISEAVFKKMEGKLVQKITLKEILTIVAIVFTGVFGAYYLFRNDLKDFKVEFNGKIKDIDSTIQFLKTDIANLKKAQDSLHVRIDSIVESNDTQNVGILFYDPSFFYSDSIPNEYLLGKR